MKPGELIEMCIKGYKAYNPNKMTIDAHLEVFLAEIGCKDEGDSVFIKQVIYGCLRFKKLNKVTLTALYFKHSSQVSREDYHLYMIMCYLTIMRLEDLGHSVFRKFVRSQDAHKMLVWLSFIFDSQTLSAWLKEEWCRIFDEQYVEDELIARLLRNLPDVSPLMERLREQAATRDAEDVDSASEERRKAPGTKVEPFNLTKPKPRSMPEPIPIKIENPFKKPVPKSVRDPEGDGTMRKVEEARRRAKEETLKTAARAKAPDFETEKLPDKKVVRAGKYKEALAQEAERAAELASRYIPPRPTDPEPALRAAEGASVRLNAAAVLREDALLRRRQEKEAATINKYESELRDDSEFYEWQARMRDRDERKRLEEVEQRRVAMILSDENAKEAVLQRERDNARLAEEMRREGMAIRALAQAGREEALMEKRSLVEDVKNSEKAAGVAVAAAAEARAMTAIEIREEARRLEEERRETARREEEARMDLVRQIRALESVPTERAAQFDGTTVSEGSRHVLEAMSYAELEERLAMARRRKSEEEEERRQSILAEKQAKEEDLRGRAEAVQRGRAVRERVAQDLRRRKQEKEEEDKRIRAQIRYEAQVKLQGEMEARRKARMEEEARLQEELRQLDNRKQILAAGASQMEERKFREVESGAERKLREKDAMERAEHAAYLAAMAQEERNRNLNMERRAERKQAQLAAYDATLRQGKAEMVDALANDHAEKRQTVAQTRDASSALKDRQVAADPSRHLTNVASIDRSRSLRAARLSSISPPRARLGTGGSSGSGGGGRQGVGGTATVGTATVRDTLAARAKLLREATAP